MTTLAAVGGMRVEHVRCPGGGLEKKKPQTAISRHLRELLRPPGSDIVKRHTASAKAKLHIWLDGGVRTTMPVALRWKNFGAECWLNLQAKPTMDTTRPLTARLRPEHAREDAS